MKEINTLLEAEQWFLVNCYGTVTCVHSGQKKECSTFPEARAFFDRYGTDCTDEDTSSLAATVFVALDTIISESSIDPPAETSSPESTSFESGGGDFGGAGSGSDY